MWSQICKTVLSLEIIESVSLDKRIHLYHLESIVYTVYVHFSMHTVTFLCIQYSFFIS